MKEAICKMLDISEYDPVAVKDKLVSIRVTATAALIPEYNMEPKMAFVL